MGDIYVYAKDAQEFVSLGLCGPLTPVQACVTCEAGGLSEVTVDHPVDEMGRWTCLQVGNILRVPCRVRTLPAFDDAGAQVVSAVERYAVKPTATKAQRYLYTKNTGGKKVALLKPGTVITVARKTASRYYAYYKKHKGWIDVVAIDLQLIETIPLAQDADAIEDAAPSVATRDQLHRIYKVEKRTAEGVITAYARHIAYDLLGNMTMYAAEGSVTAREALTGILNNCADAHEFSAYTNIADSRIGVDWARNNPIKALLDTETGFAARWTCELCYDNYDLYLLSRVGQNRGVRIERGKNLVGVTWTQDDTNVVTKIVPYGERKNGTILYLGDGAGMYIVSERAADYPTPHVYALKVQDAKEGSGVNVELARNRMRTAAQAMLDAGCDLPAVSLDVDFVALGDTDEGAQYRDLELIYNYDTVTVYDPAIGVDQSINVVRTEWDPLTDRYIRIELGALTDISAKIPASAIPTGISGGKLLGGSVGSSALRDDIISARHVQADSIGTSALAAGSVTAEKIAAGAIAADAIEAVRAQIARITAENISTDTLAAALAAFGSLNAKTGAFDFATVQHLVSSALNVENASGENVFIRNLSLDTAQIVQATVGNLVLKGEDANGDAAYYRLDVAVTADGVPTITPVNVTVTDDEIQAGATADGTRTIIETNLTVSDLQATNLRGTYALINRIEAARIDVDELFARAAFIAALETSDIWSSASVNQAVKDRFDSEIKSYARLTENGMVVGVAGEDVLVVADGRATAPGFVAREFVQVGGVRIRRASDGGLMI